jgi:dipeptidyl aminopeptidase/acylaminoacyl peptidase
MTIRQRLTVFLLSLGLVPLSLLSHAAAVPSKPDPVIVVDRPNLPKPLLKPDEVETIKTLQSFVTPAIASTISADETTVVMRVSNGISNQATYSFLNLNDGTKVEINLKQLGDWKLAACSKCRKEFYWRSNEQAIALVWKSTPQGAIYAIANINRNTGAIRLEPLALPGIILSFSPDASKVLIRAHRPSPTPAATTANGESEFNPDVNPDIYANQNDDAGFNTSLANRTSQRTNQPPNTTITELRVINLADGSEDYRFSLPAETWMDAIAWSNDNQKIALSLTASLTRPTDIRGTLLNWDWTRNAMGLLAPSENPYLQKSRLLLLDLSARTDKLIYAAQGDGSVFSALSWSPDGKRLLSRMEYPVQLEGRSHPSYWESNRVGFCFYSADLQRQDCVNQPELASPISQGEFITNDQVLFTSLTGMDTHLYRFDRDQKKLRKLTQVAGSHGTYGAVFLPQQQQVIASFNSFTAPPELYRMDADGDQHEAITTLNKAIAQLPKLHTETVTFELNQQTFEGQFVQPANQTTLPKDQPLVVWQMGGPYAPITNNWSSYVSKPTALLPHFGFTVLVLPLYGRYGYGTERFNKLYDGQNYGQVDIDLMADVMQMAIAKQYTTPGKIGITGCSYGGYFTTQSLVRHPDLYSAANTQCSLIDMVSEWTRGTFVGGAFLYGSLTPYNAPQEFQSDSPAYNWDQIRTPLLIFHGSQDFLPVTAMENYYSTLAEKGVPTRMVKFMGAAHGMVDVQNSRLIDYELYAAQEQIQWFRTHLKP